MFFTLFFVLSLTSSTNAQADKDSIRAETHIMIDRLDSLRKTAQYDSAIVIGKQALGNAETEFGSISLVCGCVI